MTIGNVNNESKKKKKTLKNVARNHANRVYISRARVAVCLIAVITCRAGAGASYFGSDKRFASTGVVEVGDAGAAIATDRHRRLANRCCRLRSASTNQLWRRGWKSHYRRCCCCCYPLAASTSRVGFRRARPIPSWCAVSWTVQP